MRETIQRNIAKNLKRVMDSRGQSAAEFAEDIGVSKAAMLQYLRGASNPTVDTLVVLSEGTGIPPAELISDPPPG